jgi:hypothetical protein
MVAFVHNRPVRGPTAVSHPDTPRGAHNGVDRGGESASRLDAFDSAILVTMNVGLAIGDSYELQATQTLAHYILEMFFAPDRHFRRSRPLAAAHVERIGKGSYDPSLGRGRCIPKVP